MNELILEIKKAVSDSALSHQKIAMFHFQILRNAAALEKIDPIKFCDAIGVPRTYKTEFRKMLSLALVMKQQDSSLS